MPRQCTICTHPQRDEIDAELVRGVAFRIIAERFGTSATALFRHRSDHIAALLAEAHEADVERADDLLAQLRGLQARTMKILDTAEKGGKLGVALMAISQAGRNIELLAKLTHQLDERAQVNIVVTPQYVEMRAVLLRALAPFPEARLAVAEGLALLEAGA